MGTFKKLCVVGEVTGWWVGGCDANYSRFTVRVNYSGKAHRKGDKLSESCHRGGYRAAVACTQRRVTWAQEHNCCKKYLRRTVNRGYRDENIHLLVLGQVILLNRAVLAASFVVPERRPTVPGSIPHCTWSNAFLIHCAPDVKFMLGCNSVQSTPSSKGDCDISYCALVYNLYISAVSYNKPLLAGCRAVSRHTARHRCRAVIFRARFDFIALSDKSEKDIISELLDVAGSRFIRRFLPDPRAETGSVVGDVIREQ
ncbi:hypothetical protein J6590_028342 [Homalodisca vitripennis]|nr:hypothetical protein J6590_028342 [Homalodisca vitripennis]